MKLIPLKNDKFKYINKTYVQKRFVNEDRTLYFSIDDLDYVKVYAANDEGKGELVYELYHKDNPSAYPIYGLEMAIEKINAMKLTFSNKFIIHPSQFAKKQK